jgi:nucleotide-binding universal stress UspA family protein
MTRPYVIVVGTDYSAHAAHALHIAYEHARSHAPAELHVVHASLAVGADGTGGEPLPFESPEQQRARLVEHLQSELGKLAGFRSSQVRVQAHVLLDAPGFALTSLATELNADLLVVGSHGRRGIARWLLGSVAEAVVRQASCPVLVVPPPPRPSSSSGFSLGVSP